jgi:hypothetical protein
MKLRQAAALDGIQWARSGFVMIKSQPMAHVAMVMAMSLGLGLLASLPWIGPLCALTLLPALSAGWVFSSATVQAQVRTSPARLLAPLSKSRRTAMLQLGLLHMLACVAVLWVADLLDPDFRNAMTQAVGSQPGVSEEQALAALDAVRAGMLMRGAMLMPVALLFWHAPVIVHRIGGSAARALFASGLASWRNLGAFVVYGLTWLVADLLLSGSIGVLASATGQPQLIMMLVLPAAIVFAAAFYASLHASVHACIEFDEVVRANAAAAAAASTASQDK